jgi:hypothetical protein
LILGTKWHQLAHHGIDNKFFNPYQFRGLQGRDAFTPAFTEEEEQWEISHLNQKPQIRLDFDATSCKDRIILSLAGQSLDNINPYALSIPDLEDAKYLLKTKLGVSEEFFKHHELSQIYGTGQGSANSPVIWVLDSTSLPGILQPSPWSRLLQP